MAKYIAGRYEVIRCLGSGSLGVVYACKHRELDSQTVAVKVLFKELIKDETTAIQFRDSVTASYRVSHPNVLQIYEYLREEELTLYSMQYVRGGSLADLLSSGKELSIDKTISLLLEMTAGLQAIHEANLVHGNLKPENILLSLQEGLKIADFGIRKPATQVLDKIPGQSLDTSDYFSPEYLENKEGNVLSDVYALGILAYEILTLEVPLVGENLAETIGLRKQTDPEPVQETRPDCPQELDEIILKAMAHKPDQRYSSAQAFGEDLQILRRSRLS